MGSFVQLVVSYLQAIAWLSAFYRKIIQVPTIGSSVIQHILSINAAPVPFILPAGSYHASPTIPTSIPACAYGIQTPPLLIILGTILVTSVVIWIHLRRCSRKQRHEERIQHVLAMATQFEDNTLIGTPVVVKKKDDLSLFRFRNGPYTPVRHSLLGRVEPSPVQVWNVNSVIQYARYGRDRGGSAPGIVPHQAGRQDADSFGTGLEEISETSTNLSIDDENSEVLAKLDFTAPIILAGRSAQARRSVGRLQAGNVVAEKGIKVSDAKKPSSFTSNMPPWIRPAIRVAGVRRSATRKRAATVGAIPESLLQLMTVPRRFTIAAIQTDTPVAPVCKDQGTSYEEPVAFAQDAPRSIASVGCDAPKLEIFHSNEERNEERDENSENDNPVVGCPKEDDKELKTSDEDSMVMNLSVNSNYDIGSLHNSQDSRGLTAFEIGHKEDCDTLDIAMEQLDRMIAQDNAREAEKAAQASATPVPPALNLLPPTPPRKACDSAPPEYPVGIPSHQDIGPPPNMPLPPLPAVLKHTSSQPRLKAPVTLLRKGVIWTATSAAKSAPSLLPTEDLHHRILDVMYPDLERLAAQILKPCPVATVPIPKDPRKEKQEHLRILMLFSPVKERFRLEFEKYQPKGTETAFTQFLRSYLAARTAEAAAEHLKPFLRSNPAATETDITIFITGLEDMELVTPTVVVLFEDYEKQHPHGTAQQWNEYAQNHISMANAVPALLGSELEEKRPTPALPIPRIKRSPLADSGRGAFASSQERAQRKAGKRPASIPVVVKKPAIKPPAIGAPKKTGGKENIPPPRVPVRTGKEQEPREAIPSGMRTKTAGPPSESARTTSNSAQKGFASRLPAPPRRWR